VAAIDIAPFALVNQLLERVSLGEGITPVPQMDTEDAVWLPAAEDSHADDWFRRLWRPGKRVFHQALGLGVVQSDKSHLSSDDGCVSVLWWNDVLSEGIASELMPFFSYREPVRRLLTNDPDDLCFFEVCPRWSAGDTRLGLSEPFSITSSPLALVQVASSQKYVSPLIYSLVLRLINIRFMFLFCFWRVVVRRTPHFPWTT
jgi:hypothetical protein